MPDLTVFAVGGPTAVLDYAGLRLITDPTFDPPCTEPDGLVKLNGPAASEDEVGAIDVALVSHDHHSDNLDQAGAIVPVHFDGWSHFTQGSDELRAAFDAAGIGERLVVPEPGATVRV